MWEVMTCCDAEHPTVIPMDVLSSPNTPREPMTRARARATETKVNSLLSQLTHSTCETWLLPQAETLCVIRYSEEGHEFATTNGQDGVDTKRKRQEEELQKNYSHWTTDPYWTSGALKISQCHLSRTKIPEDRSLPDTRDTGCPTFTGNPTTPVQNHITGCPAPSRWPDAREPSDDR